MSNLEPHDRNRRRTATFGALVIAVPALVFAIIAAPRSRARPANVSATDVASTAPDKNEPAPNFDLKTLSGKRVKLTDFAGKVVVINFWAT
jgi:cytochrome oxidase Cu insertion factor (SCO1/SenC/PrrC family)